MQKELLNIIYDTLMQNNQHPQLDLSLVGDETQIDNDNQLITLEYQDKCYTIEIKEILK